MVKYKLVRPGTEEYEEKKAEQAKEKRHFRGPIALFKDTVQSYRDKKEAVSDYYQNMVDEQKHYYDHDDDWQIQEQYKRDREFTVKLLKYGAVALVLIGLYWLLRTFF